MASGVFGGTKVRAGLCVGQIKTTVMEVEFPLIKAELEGIDVKLLTAETTLFWNGEGTPPAPRRPWA